MGRTATLLGMLAVCSFSVSAEERAAEAQPYDTVRIQVMAIAASNVGTCDPQVAFLRPRLRRVLNYRSFRLLSDTWRDVAWQDTAAFALAGGTRLMLLPKGREAQQVVLQVRLLDGRRALVDTVVRLRNQGYMVFGVERDPSAEEALLVVLRAED
jgi:hypothetical protein